MNKFHLFPRLIFLGLEGMTTILSVKTVLGAKWTRHKKGQICVLFKGYLSLFIILLGFLNKVLLLQPKILELLKHGPQS